MKTIKLILEDLRSINSDLTSAFRVKKAVNTVQYEIGSYLSKSEVQGLCQKPGYQVDIVSKS